VVGPLLVDHHYRGSRFQGWPPQPDPMVVASMAPGGSNSSGSALTAWEVSTTVAVVEKPAEMRIAEEAMMAKVVEEAVTVKVAADKAAAEKVAADKAAAMKAAEEAMAKVAVDAVAMETIDQGLQ
jgi:hypothetical protein